MSERIAENRKRTAHGGKMQRLIFSLRIPHNEQAIAIKYRTIKNYARGGLDTRHKNFGHRKRKVMIAEMSNAIVLI